MQSVLRDWVMELPLREQGTLVGGLRGCDTVTGHIPGSEDHPTKRLVKALRYAIMNPADQREVDTNLEDGYMAAEPESPVMWPVKCLDNLPTHFVAHLMHAIEVVAHRHPDERERYIWWLYYHVMCRYLHVKMETREEMIARLSADRVREEYDPDRANRVGTFHYP